MSARAEQRLGAIRGAFAERVDEQATVLAQDGARLRWWTFAGARANAVLAAALGAVAPELLDDWSYSNLAVTLRSDATPASVTKALGAARARFGDDFKGVEPEVSPQAIKKLKFSELLPPAVSVSTLSARGADHGSAAKVLCLPVRGWVR